MRLFRCDRCKKEYTFNEYTIDDCKLGMRNPNETALIVELPVDLCDDCRKDFEAWFRQPMVDKAFEEAHAKAHAHEKGEVTVLALKTGDYLCPVCGCVMADGEFLGKQCPECKTPFAELANYVNIEVQKTKENEQ